MPGNIRLWGTSGYVELAAPSTAANQVLTLPTDSVQPGMVLIASQTFSAASSVLVNNCFTATYQNYRVIIDLSTVSATGFTNLQLTSSGTASTTGYARSAGYTPYGSTTVFGESQNNASSYNLVYSNTTSGGVAIVDLMRPAQSVRTYIAQQIINFGSNGGWGNGEHGVSSSYDGFVLTPASGTITGVLRIYGYRNS